MALGAVLMVLGDALGLIWLPVPRRHFAWQARHKLISILICVLGVAQPHIFNFSWQAAKKLRSTIIFCGRRGTHGTGSLSLIWSPLAPGQFAWQTWHKPTSTGFLRGRRRTNSHLLFFTWQAWHSWQEGFRLPILDGRVHEQVSSVLFLQCFLKASVTTYQKQEVLAEKCPPPQVNL